MSAVLFFIAATGVLAGAIGVVMLRNPFYSVLALVGHLICLAALFLLLRAEFVAAAQVVVYAGAVMVLYVFVVAYIGGGDDPLVTVGGALKVLGPVFALALAIELCIALLGSALKGIAGHGAPYVPGFGTPREIGRLFLTTYLFPFEIASLLLMVAAVGAVVLARRRRGLEDEDVEPELQPARPVYTGTLAEAAGVRPGFGTDTEGEREAAGTTTTYEGGW
ncbi:MAG: NADH-quinone oxidoreductase subunit J [Actinomycetota bacterium]|nr:NADH-quinone oxidoreductase subunit J [Actinomycetota bacterium]